MTHLVDERMQRPSDPPSVADERESHVAHCAELLALFTQRPNQELEPTELRKITPHYQQRISELRRQGHRIENMRRWLDRGDGKKTRLDGGYRLRLETPLGRDAGEYKVQPGLWS